MPDIDAIRKTLARHGQEHLLAFAGELPPAGLEKLLGQIEAIDFDALDDLIESHVRREPEIAIPQDIDPPDILPADPRDKAAQRRYADARRLGERLIRDGKVAAFVVAGGQGTRLGYDGPKGCLGVTPLKRKSLFQVFAEQILATQRRYERAIPWYVMTSPANDAATREYFARNGHFGLSPDDVVFFVQGTMPAIALSGKLLLAEKDSLALSPDGHGGSLTALARSGSLADMARRGIEHISYFQVDNPLVRCIDPLFVGLHAEAGAEMSAKALPKRDPLEKLGNFCKVGGKTVVIEYSDLPERLAVATEPDGRLRFRAGSIAIHIISRAFAERLTAGGRCQLPFHRAVKKAPYIDAHGQPVEPPRANAVKLEQFVFDALPLAGETVILETSRIEEFSPVKNATGPDSLATCLHDQIRRSAGWLAQAGVHVPLDADGVPASMIEISPLFALDAAELAEKLPKDLTVLPGQDLYLGD